VDPLCATWKSEDCPGGPPNVLPRLPLFDGVDSPKFPKASLPENPNPKYNTLLACEVLLFLPVQVLDPSSVLPPSCLPYARTFLSPENRIKFQQRLPIQYHYTKGH
jgi:hypothetical protein